MRDNTIHTIRGFIKKHRFVLGAAALATVLYGYHKSNEPPPIDKPTGDGYSDELKEIEKFTNLQELSETLPGSEYLKGQIQTMMEDLESYQENKTIPSEERLIADLDTIFRLGLHGIKGMVVEAHKGVEGYTDIKESDVKIFQDKDFAKITLYEESINELMYTNDVFYRRKISKEIVRAIKELVYIQDKGEEVRNDTITKAKAMELLFEYAENLENLGNFEMKVEEDGNMIFVPSVENKDKTIAQTIAQTKKVEVGDEER